MYVDFVWEINLLKLDILVLYNMGVDILVGLFEFYVNNNLKRYYKDNDFCVVVYYGVEYYFSDYVVIMEEEFNKIMEVDFFLVLVFEDIKFWFLEGDILVMVLVVDCVILVSFISLCECGFKWVYCVVFGYLEG